MLGALAGLLGLLLRLLGVGVCRGARLGGRLVRLLPGPLAHMRDPFVGPAPSLLDPLVRSSLGFLHPLVPVALHGRDLAVCFGSELIDPMSGLRLGLALRLPCPLAGGLRGALGFVGGPLGVLRLGQCQLLGSASLVRRAMGVAEQGLDRVVAGPDVRDGVDHRPTHVGDGTAYSTAGIAHRIARPTQGARRRSARPAGHPHCVSRHVPQADHGPPRQPHDAMLLGHGCLLRGSQGSRAGYPGRGVLNADSGFRQ
ncbi:MAG TPA: hypothetical protein VHK25_00770 [Acidimicrobiales bacterium]|nr:hypothetical protein [Acidimicrobiales bacterium]